MTVELFVARGSPYAWRCQLGLELKGVPYTARTVVLGESGPGEVELRRLNARGRVPVLRDGDVVVTESSAILAYIDGRWPDPPLWGDDLARRAHVQETVAEIMAYVEPIAPRIYGPLRRAMSPVLPADVALATRSLRDELARFDARLAGHDWLVDGAVSAADVMLYPLVQVLVASARRPTSAGLDTGLAPLEGTFPHLAAWAARMEALPGFARVAAAHGGR